ncbi:MAG: hypothetical protein HC896_00855 [Bacteroidales bacterium]|nr:hypothetical protein [Bacteroidales bacterium]
MLTSFLHHPFYRPFVLDVPDNWACRQIYNLPLNELINVMDTALCQGHSMAWATDISEDGFSWSNGLALVPDKEVKGLGKKSKSAVGARYLNDEELFYTVQEKEITPQMRQWAFDTYETTDDHGMHIVGLAKDQVGNKFYYVKNSWGETNLYNGYLYASEAYVKYKTIAVLLNVQAIPVEIRRRLGI